MNSITTRFVCINIHRDTNELEIIVEVTDCDDNFNEKTQLISSRVSPEDFLDGTIFTKKVK